MSTNTCDPACSGKTPVCSDSKNCVQCLMDSQCTGDNKVCSKNNTCVQCLNDSQCTGVDTVCSADQMCVQCVNDSQCTGVNHMCFENKCVQCLDDSQCEAGDKHVCYNNACVECTQDNQAYCISPSGVSGFCQNNSCVSGASCRKPTTGTDASTCSKANACCFNELTGGIEPCSGAPPAAVALVGGRCQINADASPQGSGDSCRSSYECGDALNAKRLRDFDPYGPNPDIIAQFGSSCRNTASGEIVNCIEANDADPGSSIGCAGLDSPKKQHECVFCPSGSDQSACKTYIPPDSDDSNDSDQPTLRNIAWDF